MKNKSIFLRIYAFCNKIVMKSCQQDISKTIRATVGLSNLVCLYGMMSRLPDRPNTAQSGPYNHIKQAKNLKRMTKVQNTSQEDPGFLRR